MENLDRLCAKYGYEFAKDIKEKFNGDAKKAESLITKALGVLQEQGLYAFGLFCESRGSAEKPGADKLKEITLELLKSVNLINNDDLLEEIRKENGLASRLDDLMLAIHVLEKSLIYARYHGKAFSKTSEEATNNGRT